MTPERWAEAKRLFAEASARPVAERADFLAAACAHDVALRDEVASLLDAAEGSASLPAARGAIAEAAREIGAVPRPAYVAGTLDPALQRLLETALGQQYEIVRALGHGGMGAVYLARERALDRFVAIKVLRPDLAAERESRERFRREAVIAAQLSHPGILPLHTFGEVGGVWYFVMGYVRGATLAERLRTEGALPAADAHRILTELADALECAHRAGVVHRDIKPANVLLDEDTGRAMLADFGIAKLDGSVDALTATGMVVGTPSYMSPEQALGAADVDERSDVYSLGAVGYAMLAGHEPFAGLATQERTRRRIALDATPLSQVAPHTPAALAEIVMHCLARDPAERWPTARALRAALARASDEGATLPEALRELPAFGPYALLWSAIWLTVAAQPHRAIGDRALLALVGTVVPVGLLLHVRSVGSEEMTRAELARAAFWPPEWWGMWWPRALRRPTDLWPRLPWPARAARLAISAFLVMLPAMILVRQWAEALAAGSAPPGWFDATERGVIAVCAVALVVSVLWTRVRGLSMAESARFLLGATTPGAAWSDPAIKRLLRPAAGTVAGPDRDSPDDHRRAAEQLLRGDRSPAAVAHLEAIRRTVAEIERCDAELAALGRDGGGAELDRISSQLAMLERDIDVTAERRELAELLRRQLDLLRRMRVRAESVAERRGALMRALRASWREASERSTRGDPTRR